MKHFLVASFLLSLLVIPSSVFAATFEAGESYALSRDERVAGDLYAVGGDVIVSGTGTEDVTLGGGKIIMSGAVGADLLVLGGDVTLLGTMGDDVRIIAGAVSISGDVQGDLVVIGGTVRILEGSLVGGDLLALGGEVVIEGKVKGTVHAYGGDVTVRGETGPLTAKARQIILEGALIQGNFSYTSERPAMIDDSSRVEGETTRGVVPSAKADFAGLGILFGGLFFLVTFIATAVATLAVFYLFRGWSTRYARESVTSFGKNILVGLCSLIALPILSVILILTLVGAVLGVGGLLVYGLMLLVAKVLAGIVAGAVLSRVFVKEIRLTLPWVLGGIVFLEFVFLAPFVGWAISCVIYLMSLGTLSGLLYRLWQKRDSHED